MIPKVIHYCWFGKKPLPAAVKRCIRSWKRFCPDYQIIQWNEDNFDVRRHLFMRQAYDAQKWVFVSDVARLMIVWTHGGVYLDTDVELLHPLDSLLAYKAYFGMEGVAINTGVGFGAERGNPLVGAMLRAYQDAPFLKADGQYDTEPCPVKNTRAARDFGYVENGSLQEIQGMLFLPPEYLCPLDYRTMNAGVTPNTISIHHYSMSWMSAGEKAYFRYQWMIHAMKRNRLGRLVIRIKKRILP